MTTEKAEKPRKVFELKVEIWDDGEITTNITEIVPQDRGAPKKWLLERADFIRSLKSQITQTPDLIKDEIVELLGFSSTKKAAAKSAPEPAEEDFEEDDFDVE